MWLLTTYAIPAYVCKPGLGHTILTTGQRNTILYKMAGDGAQEDSDGQRHNPFMVRHS